METGEVRRRLQHAIERARRSAADRRARNDAATQAFNDFLDHVAVPLFKQIANVLKIEGYPFTVFTPSGSVRLMSDRSAQDFVEIVLDASGDEPRVVSHRSRARGRDVVETERAGGGRAPEAMHDQAMP